MKPIREPNPGEIPTNAGTLFTGGLMGKLLIVWLINALALLVNAALMPAPLLWRPRRPDAGTGEPRRGGLRR